MCAEAKTNLLSLESPDLNTIKQFLDELWRRIRDRFSATAESSTASGCSQLRMGVDSQGRCAASHAFGSTSLRGRYCCRRGSCLFLDEFNPSELI